MRVYKLSENVPLPPPRKKYPLSEMVVGQSFFVSLADVWRVRAATQYEQATKGSKFSVRRYENGFRCWRVE
jgi:hypothetical protein